MKNELMLAANKTAAMKIAKSHVRIYRIGAGWVLVTPYNVNDLDGPVQESHQMDYQMARGQRALSVCWLAMRLMGYSDDDDIYWALDNRCTTMNEMLSRAIDKLNKKARA